jgi:hypothetical protein
VENSNPKLSILIDPQEFLPKLSLLKDEMMKLRSAVEGGREYELPERHDPLYLMFDYDFLLGEFFVVGCWIGGWILLIFYLLFLFVSQGVPLIGQNISCTILKQTK